MSKARWPEPFPEQDLDLEDAPWVLEDVVYAEVSEA